MPLRLLSCVALAAFSTACVDAESVPSASMPITLVGHGKHQHYEKGGVPIPPSLLTCAQYSRAVTGVPEAETEIERCEALANITVAGLVGTVLLPATVSTAGEGISSPSERGATIVAGLGLGLAAFLTAAIVTTASDRHLREAVRLYNERRPQPGG